MTQKERQDEFKRKAANGKKRNDACNEICASLIDRIDRKEILISEALCLAFAEGVKYGKQEEDEPAVNKNPTYATNIDYFKAGEIVYAEGNDDWYPAIFKMPESHESDYMDCESIVEGENGWFNSNNTCFDLEPGMVFRKATKKEIELFNNITSKK